MEPWANSKVSIAYAKVSRITMFVASNIMKRNRVLLWIFLLTYHLGFGQKNEDSLKWEAGFTLNRYVPDRTDEFSPYLYAGEFRYNWKSTSKLDHFANLRLAGNVNNNITDDPILSKQYFSLDLGYHARWRRDSTKWRFAWGVNLSGFYVNEDITPVSDNPMIEPEDPFSRTRSKIAISPQISAEYYLNPLTYLQFAFSMSVGTPYFGDIDHLEFNQVRGFSGQAPSFGIFRRF